MNSTNWERNRFDTAIYLWRADSHTMKRVAASSTHPAFSTDGQWLSLLAGSRLYVIPPDGKQPFTVSSPTQEVLDYQWQAGGKSIVMLMREQATATEKDTRQEYGDFSVVGSDYPKAHLWSFSFNGVTQRTAPKRLTGGNFTVTGFGCSPDGKWIAFTVQPDGNINSIIHADIALLDVLSGNLSQLVKNTGSDVFNGWSPNSRSIVFSTHEGDTAGYFYRNTRLFTCDIQRKTQHELAPSFDENKDGAV